MSFDRRSATDAEPAWDQVTEMVNTTLIPVTAVGTRAKNADPGSPDRLCGISEAVEFINRCGISLLSFLLSHHSVTPHVWVSETGGSWSSKLELDPRPQTAAASQTLGTT